jgi:GNAT superfamily N-acetyltransferase
MSFAIRAARPADVPAILGLIHELAEYERLADRVVADEAAIRASLFGENPRVFCDVAKIEGVIVGQAIWFYNYSTFAGRHGIFLEDLYVQPAHRGKGVGKAFLVRLAQRCMDEGLARFEWMVLDWNAPSIAFYKSLGAEAMDEWITNRVSGDALAKLAAGG